MTESSVLRDCLTACAHRRLQVLEPRTWNRKNPPPFRSDDSAIQGMVWRVNTGAARYGENRERLVRFGIPGQPDIQGILRGGRYIGFETKVPTGKMSRYQLWYKDLFGGVGMLIAVVRSYDDTIRALDDWGIK